MFTLLKVEEVIRLLDDARNQKFPHPDSSDAVNQLRDHLVTIKDSLLAEAPSFSKLTVQNANNSIAATMDADIKALRKRIHDRMFAAQEAADEELEANGATGEHGIYQEEAVWLAGLLADFDQTFAPTAAIDRNINPSS